MIEHNCRKSIEESEHRPHTQGRAGVQCQSQVKQEQENNSGWSSQSMTCGFHCFRPMQKSLMFTHALAGHLHHCAGEQSSEEEVILWIFLAEGVNNSIEDVWETTGVTRKTTRKVWESCMSSVGLWVRDRSWWLYSFMTMIWMQITSNDTM